MTHITLFLPLPQSSFRAARLKILFVDQHARACPLKYDSSESPSQLGHLPIRTSGAVFVCGMSSMVCSWISPASAAREPGLKAAHA